MTTYPENFAKRDTKFLKPRELKSLVDTSFWELGNQRLPSFLYQCF